MGNSEIVEYYNLGFEKERLFVDYFQLERIRSMEIIKRYLTKPKMSIVDIGGGTGFYSFWLAEQGYNVHLIDLTPKNIEIALEHSKDKGISLGSIKVGDATKLDYNDNTFDIALLFGPLYHLVNKEDRIKSLVEAKRVLKKGGILLCVAISRYASMLDGYFKDIIKDRDFEKMMRDDLNNGQHRNTTGNFDYFTTAYLHHPEELKEEIKNAGFELDKVIPIEGFGCALPDFDEKWKNEDYQNSLLKTLEIIENDSSITGITAHLMGIGKKK